ncbi:hypothetical protein AB8B23_01395 [Leptotrichia sp. HSP-342]|uniref:Lipoprotein n=1 Tax=Leptotrichia mesophila TaxID=3239303 RepID=A0AB39VAA7_9FUSO
MKKITMYTVLALSALSSASCSYFKVDKNAGEKSGNICTYSAKGEFIGCKPIK